MRDSVVGRHFVASFLVLAAVFVFPAAASAQTPQPSKPEPPIRLTACAPRGVIEKGLPKRYKEVLLFRGLSEKTGILVALLWNPATGTWSFLATDPRRGLTCIVAAGQAGELADPPDLEEGAALARRLRDWASITH